METRIGMPWHSNNPSQHSTASRRTGYILHYQSLHLATFLLSQYDTTPVKDVNEVWQVWSVIIFRNPFLLCCVSFILLNMILLVSCTQTAFARRKRSGYARLGRMVFHLPVCAAKKCFRFVPCLNKYFELKTCGAPTPLGTTCCHHSQVRT